MLFIHLRNIVYIINIYIYDIPGRIISIYYIFSCGDYPNSTINASLNSNAGENDPSTVQDLKASVTDFNSQAPSSFEDKNPTSVGFVYNARKKSTFILIKGLPCNVNAFKTEIKDGNSWDIYSVNTVDGRNPKQPPGMYKAS